VRFVLCFVCQLLVVVFRPRVGNPEHAPHKQAAVLRLLQPSFADAVDPVYEEEQFEFLHEVVELGHAFCVTVNVLSDAEARAYQPREQLAALGRLVHAVVVRVRPSTLSPSKGRRQLCGLEIVWDSTLANARPEQQAYLTLALHQIRYMAGKLWQICALPCTFVFRDCFIILFLPLIVGLLRSPANYTPVYVSMTDKSRVSVPFHRLFVVVAVL